MEDYVAEDLAPVEKCLTDVARSDVYLGIFARRYGFVPDHHTQSITELEYRKATERQIPRLIFLLEESVDWPRDHTDTGEAGERLASLRGELMRERLVSTFTGPDDLAAKVTASAATILPTLAGHVRVGPDLADTRGFRDRQQQLGQLRHLLRDASVKLICIIGRSGIGKTWLLSEVAAQVERGDIRLSEASGRVGADGIVHFRCGPADRPTLERLYLDFAMLLGKRRGDELMGYWRDPSRSIDDKAAFLLSHFREGCYLLLIDGLEEALAPDNSIADPQFGAFLAACLTSYHSLRMVVTTRRAPMLPLEVAGAFGRFRTDLSLDEGLPQPDAVALLRELDADGKLGLANAPEGVLLDVVRRLNCVPRSLAILVGMLKSRGTWTLSRLLAEGDAFARLVANPARELHATLSSQERLAQQALAAYGRPAPVETVSALLPDLEEPAANVLDRLVANHAAVYSDETMCYSLHPLDAEYAYSQLPSDDSRNGRSRLHIRAAHHLVAGDAKRRQWRTPADLLPELRAFEHLLRAEYYDTAYRLLDTFDFDYLWLWGYCEKVVELRRQLEGRLANTFLQQLNAGNLGLALWSVGRYQEALARFERAVQLSRGRRDWKPMAAWLGNMGLCYYSMGQLDEAAVCQRRALRLDFWSRNTIGRGVRLCDLGVALRGLGMVTRSMRASERGLRFSQRSGDARVECNHLANLGHCHLLLEQVAEARRFFDRGLSIAVQLGSGAGKYYHYRGLAYCALKEGDPSAALRCALNAQAVDYPSGAHRAALLVGTAGLVSGRATESEGALLESVERCDALLDRCCRNHDALYCRAAALAALGRTADAEAAYDGALRVCSAPGAVRTALLDLSVLNSVSGEALTLRLRAHAGVLRRPRQR